MGQAKSAQARQPRQGKDPRLVRHECELRLLYDKVLVESLPADMAALLEQMP